MFTEIRFWLLVAFSLVIPIGIYAVLLATRSISQRSVLMFGLALLVIAGVDVYLLQALAAIARVTPSIMDHAAFLSDLSVALYLLPALHGGLGVNIISHILVRHLVEAENRFRKEQYGA